MLILNSFFFLCLCVTSALLVGFDLFVIVLCMSTSSIILYPTLTGQRTIMGVQGWGDDFSAF